MSSDWVAGKLFKNGDIELVVLNLYGFHRSNLQLFLPKSYVNCVLL